MIEEFPDKPLGGDWATPEEETPKYTDRVDLDHNPVQNAPAGSTCAKNVKKILARLAF